jgi:hypothetical protein
MGVLEMVLFRWIRRCEARTRCAQQRSGRRWRRLAAWFLVVMVPLSLVEPALSDEKADERELRTLDDFDVLDLVVTADLLESCFKAELVLSEPQWDFVQREHSAYWEDLVALERESREWLREFQQRASREEAEARAAGEDPTAVEIEHATELERKWASFNRRSDALLNAWLERIRPVLSEGQQVELEHAMRLVRRANLLHIDPRDLSHTAPMVSRIDTLELAREAMEDDGELAPLTTVPRSNPTTDRERELLDARKAIEAILRQLVLEEDVWLRRLLRDVRQPGTVDEEDVGTISAEKAKKYGRLWWRFFEPRNRAVTQIADEVEQCLGAPARRAWERRYWLTLHHPAMRDLPLDDATERLAECDGIAPETLEAVLIALEAYERERHEQQRKIIEAAARALRTNGELDGPHPAQLDHARAILDLIELHDRWQSQIEDSLAGTGCTTKIDWHSQYPPVSPVDQLRSAIGLTAKIELGLIDPTRIERIRNPKTLEWDEWEYWRDPETGNWFSRPVKEHR